MGVTGRGYLALSNDSSKVEEVMEKGYRARDIETYINAIYARNSRRPGRPRRPLLTRRTSLPKTMHRG